MAVTSHLTSPAVFFFNRANGPLDGIVGIHIHGRDRDWQRFLFGYLREFRCATRVSHRCVDYVASATQDQRGRHANALAGASDEYGYHVCLLFFKI